MQQLHLVQKTLRMLTRTKSTVGVVVLEPQTPPWDQAKKKQRTQNENLTAPSPQFHPRISNLSTLHPPRFAPLAKHA